jgi:succinoglycan biosynthesis transport protein ExoP
MDIAEFLRVLWRRRLVVLAVVVLVVGGGLVFLNRQRPVYEASATVALLPNAARPDTLGAYDTVVGRLIPLYANLVRSRTFLERVAARLPDQPSGKDLEGRVFARPVQGAASIDIVARAPDPGRAARMAAEATRQFQQEVGSNGVVTIRVTNEVFPPEAPVAPRPKLIIAASLLLAAMLAVALALVWERLFARIRDLGQLQAIPEQRVLGSFPYGRALHRSSPPPFVGNPALQSVEESVRTIRNVHIGPGRAAPTFRTVAVTSLTPRVGKSTLTANLAVVIAEVGPHVLVVDANVRAPRLHEIFRLPNDRGVNSPVVGDGDVASAVQATEYPRVSVLTAGPSLANRSEYAELYVHVIPKLGELADFVLVDCPALSVDADVGLLAAMTDGIILLVRYGATSTVELNAVLERLADTGVPVLGLVLTMGPK